MLTEAGRLMKTILVAVRYVLLLAVGVILGAYYQSLHDGENQGHLQLNCRVLSEVGKEGDMRTLQLLIRSRCRGFAWVVEVYENKARLIWVCDVDRPVNSDIDYIIDACQAHRHSLLLVGVTQTPVCFDIDKAITDDLMQDARLGERFPNSNPTPASVLVYGLLARRGHNWVATAELGKGQKGTP